MDFTDFNALEYIAVADEVVYSALLRWLFGADSPLALDKRVRVLGQLTGTDYGGCTATYTTTEWKHVDLVIDLKHPAGSWRIAVENKVKAEESPNQLAIYDPKLDGATKLFLTLTGESPRSGAGDWRAISYAKLRDIVRPFAGDNLYIADYCEMISRLVHATELIQREPEIYAAFVFDPKKRLGAKEQKPQRGRRPLYASPPVDFARYVDTLRLRKVLQRVWLQTIAHRAIERVPQGVDARWTVSVVDEKQSLMNVETEVYTFGTVGVQLQHEKLKFFTRPDGYPKRSTSIEAAEQLLRVLTQMHPHLKPCSEEPTMHKGKGFRSFVSEEFINTYDLNAAAAIVAKHIGRLIAAVDTLEHSGELVRRPTAA